MKNKLLQAMKSLPMLAEDKEKFVNIIVNNSNSGGDNENIVYNYYKVTDTALQEGYTYIMTLLGNKNVRCINTLYNYEIGILDLMMSGENILTHIAYIKIPNKGYLYLSQEGVFFKIEINTLINTLLEKEYLTKYKDMTDEIWESQYITLENRTLNENFE